MKSYLDTLPYCGISSIRLFPVEPGRCRTTCLIFCLLQCLYYAGISPRCLALLHLEATLCVTIEGQRSFNEDGDADDVFHGLLLVKKFQEAGNPALVQPCFHLPVLRGGATAGASPPTGTKRAMLANVENVCLHAAIIAFWIFLSKGFTIRY